MEYDPKTAFGNFNSSRNYQEKSQRNRRNQSQIKKMKSKEQKIEEAIHRMKVLDIRRSEDFEAYESYMPPTPTVNLKVEKIKSKIVIYNLMRQFLP